MTPHVSEASNPGNCVISAWPLAFDILLTAHCVERKGVQQPSQARGSNCERTIVAYLRRSASNQLEQLREIQFLIVLDAILSNHVCFERLIF